MTITVDEAKKKLAENQAAQEKARALARETKGDVSDAKPTPTQEENDLAKLGAHVIEKEPDGSPEDPNAILDPNAPATKQAEAKPAGASYQTRAATPAEKRSPESSGRQSQS